MQTPRQMLCAALAAGCFFTTTVAEARFGKAGSSQSSGGSSYSGRSKAAGGSSSSGGSSRWKFHAHRGDSPRPQRHAATPVGQEPDGAPSNDGGGKPEPDSDRPVVVPRPVWFPPIAGSAYHHRRYRSHWVSAREADEPNRRLLFRMGVDGTALREGGAMGFGMGIEGRRWGISTRLTTLLLQADDGSDEMDRIHLAEANVTLAAYASPRARFRVEGGVAWARAADVLFIGPSAALSFERCLFGALDMEGRAQWVPLPHLQLDGQIGLAVHLGVLSLRGGWRGLLLDDRGHVDGVRHRDKMKGPYAGLGLSF